MRSINTFAKIRVQTRLDICSIIFQVKDIFYTGIKFLENKRSYDCRYLIIVINNPFFILSFFFRLSYLLHDTRGTIRVSIFYTLFLGPRCFPR